MKCRILFSGKNEKNIINLSSTEVAQRVVKVDIISGAFGSRGGRGGGRGGGGGQGRPGKGRGE